MAWHHTHPALSVSEHDRPQRSKRVRPSPCGTGAGPSVAEAISVSAELPNASVLSAHAVPQ